MVQGDAPVRRALALAEACLMVLAPLASGFVPTEARVVSPSQFAPIDLRALDPTPAAATEVPVELHPPIVETLQRPPVAPGRPDVRVEAAVVRSEPKDAPAAASGGLVGKASWYCKAGVSICHYAYPPGSMVAAACLKLRRAMGKDWRGQRVTVTAGSRSVEVTLVDWCGSTTKAIDLYWEPMRRLGGTGVLKVRVVWR